MIFIPIFREGKKKKKKKEQHVIGDQTKLVKLGQKGQWELKNLLLSLNVEYGSKKLRRASMEWAVVSHQ